MTYEPGRDPARIEQFMKELTILWQMQPDMRFFQLVSVLKGMVPENKRGVSNDCFYTEDDAALDAIRLYGEMLKEPYV